MNYPILKFIPVITLLASGITAQAQEVVGHSTDSNYFNTTIVYKKGNIDDQSVLQKIENNYGMGDVIRIADAPAPAPAQSAVAPVPVMQNAVFTTPPVQINNIATTARPQAEVIQNDAKASSKTNNVTPAPAPRQTVAVKTARAASGKSAKRQKVLYKAPVKRKKHGKQRYGCPKF